MRRDSQLQLVFDSAPVIAPSMLKCDFSDLGGEIAALDRAGSRVLHWDVMDGHFVPNLSYGAMVIAAQRKRTEQLFDAHLMIADPARYLDDFLAAGCDAITFHLEAVPEPRALLRAIRTADRLAGLAINPGTPVDALRPFVDDCDVLLIMSVEPGFGGQAFLPAAIEKVRQARELAGPKTIVSVDGGIGPSTIAECARAGADLFVAGSSVFDTDDYSAAMRVLRDIAGPCRNSLS